MARKEILVAVPSVALAVFAHPDDMEMNCGGTLATWAAAGCDVHVVVVTAGDKGSLDPDADPRALVAQRAEECRAAARALGATVCEEWEVPDGEVERARHDLLARLVATIRRVKPEAVIGHDPTATFVGRYYVNHADHRALGWITADAVAPAAWSPHYYPEAGPAHRVSRLLLAGSPSPDVVVDISGVVAVKAAALACHRTQLGPTPPDATALAELVRSRGRAAAAGTRLTAAETFRLMEPG